MTRYLILAAVLAAGCEQLKAPQKIHELEDRVDQLTSEVATLKGSGAKPGEHAGSGSAAPGEQAGSAAGSGEGSGGGSGDPLAAAGSGSAEPAGEHAGSGSGTPGEHAGSAEPSEHDGAGSAAGSGDQVAAVADAGVSDGGAPSADDKAARALEELRAVVAAQTGKPAAAPPAPAPAPAAASSKPSTPPGSAKAAAPAPPPGPGLPQWSYDGKFGPPTWGTLDPSWRACLAGKAQSPIDIEPRAGTASPIVFHYKPTPATLVDDGHTLRVDFGPGSTIEIDGHAYQLLKLHFHAPSEHTIAGEHYPLEADLVHQDSDGRTAMVSVLFDTGAESKALGALWSKWPAKVGAEDKLKKPFDPGELLPETRTVFRYAGSLTQPPCAEGVTWNVMRRAISDSKAHLEGFARHYPHNIRDVQPLGARKVE